MFEFEWNEKEEKEEKEEKDALIKVGEARVKLMVIFHLQNTKIIL